MAVRYVKDFEFPSAAGYTKSTPSKVTGQMFAKGGHVKRKYADGGNVDSAGMAQMAGDAAATQDAQNTMTTPPMTPQQRQKLMMIQAAKRRAMMQKQQQAAQDTRMNDVPPGANYDQGQMQRAEQGYKKGGKVAKVMHEFGEGKLHSGSKKGPKVTNPKQAVAIALSEAGKSKKGYAEGGKAKKVELPIEEEAPYPSQWPMPSDEQINKENWNQRKAIRRAMGAKNTGKDTFAKGGMAHEDVAEDKSLIKSMVKPDALKKADGGMAQKVQMAKSNAIESSLKGQKKTGYADGGIAAPRVASPLQMMGRAKGVPVAPRGPMIPQQSPAPGGARIGVNQARPGQPNVGAIRAAMARKASQAMPENAPSMMKTGGKVGC